MAAHRKTMWFHLRRSPYQACAAILMMSITFLMMTAFSYLLVGSHVLLQYFESRPQVNIFFTNETSQSTIDALGEDLRANSVVSSVTFVSKEQALAIYREQNKDDPLLLELVTEDILPASLEVTTYEAADLRPIADALAGNPAIQQVVFQRDIVERLAFWLSALRQVGIAIIVLLAIESLLVITIIIGIKIAQRRNEIELMQLIGATKGYIAAPFVYEGILYGMVGAVVGWSIASGFLYYYAYLIEQSGFFAGIPVLPVPWELYAIVFGAMAAVGIIFGYAASMIAVRRYFRS